MNLHSEEVALCTCVAAGEDFILQNLVLRRDDSYIRFVKHHHDIGTDFGLVCQSAEGGDNQYTTLHATHFFNYLGSIQTIGSFVLIDRLDKASFPREIVDDFELFVLGMKAIHALQDIGNIDVFRISLDQFRKVFEAIFFNITSL